MPALVLRIGHSFFLLYPVYRLKTRKGSQQMYKGPGGDPGPCTKERKMEILLAGLEGLCCVFLLAQEDRFLQGDIDDENDH